MKLLKIFSIIGICLGISLLSFSAYTILSEKKPAEGSTEIPPNTLDENSISNKQPKQDQNTFSKKLDNTENRTDNYSKQNEQKVVETKLSQSTWIPYWAFSLGFESLKENKEIIDTVNPVLYSINSNGQLQRNNISEQQLKELLQYSKQNNIRVIPTVSSNNFANMDKLLSSIDNYQLNIKHIVEEVNKYDFDGIDLDYEAINSTNQKQYIDYLAQLKAALGNRIFSISLLPQWEDAQYTEKAETRSIQKYSVIGSIADEIRIMTYDYTSPTSPNAGPIAPIDWIEQVIAYAKQSGISTEKIYLGIHLYSYEWNNGKVSALTNTTVKNIVEKIWSSAKYDTKIAEGYAQYTCAGSSTCTLYYQTNQGVKERNNLAKKYALKGVAYWRIGGELDLLK